MSHFPRFAKVKMPGYLMASLGKNLQERELNTHTPEFEFLFETDDHHRYWIAKAWVLSED
jgi:hypothetical protein